MELTQNLGLQKPAKTEKYGVEVANANADIIDAKYGEMENKLKTEAPISFNADDDFVTADISYIVKAGVCYVTIHSTVVTSVGSYRTLSTNMPRAKHGDYKPVVNAFTGSPVAMAFIDANTSTLYMHTHAVDANGYASLCYPVDN